MKKFWNFTESDEGRSLCLEGAISEETWWGDEVTPAAFKAELSAGSGNITEEEVELLTSPLELASYKNAITEAMFKGTARNVVSEGGDSASKNSPAG